jgi:hypothetical protein
MAWRRRRPLFFPSRSETPQKAETSLTILRARFHKMQNTRRTPARANIISSAYYTTAREGERGKMKNGNSDGRRMTRKIDRCALVCCMHLQSPEIALAIDAAGWEIVQADASCTRCAVIQLRGSQLFSILYFLDAFSCIDGITFSWELPCFLF